MDESNVLYGITVAMEIPGDAFNHNKSTLKVIGSWIRCGKFEFQSTIVLRVEKNISNQKKKRFVPKRRRKFGSRLFHSNGRGLVLDIIWPYMRQIASYEHSFQNDWSAIYSALRKKKYNFQIRITQRKPSRVRKLNEKRWTSQDWCNRVGEGSERDIRSGISPSIWIILEVAKCDRGHQAGYYTSNWVRQANFANLRLGSGWCHKNKRCQDYVSDVGDECGQRFKKFAASVVQLNAIYAGYTIDC